MYQANPGRFSGQLECLVHILRTEGLRGLLRGSLLTLARDVPAFCAYFATYETLRSKLQEEDGTIGLGQTVGIGGLAGVVAWALALPLDSLKNRYQVRRKKVFFRSQHEHQVCLKQTSLIRLLSDLRRQPGGLSQLYRGAAVVLLRAFPANAATFIGWGQLDLQLRSLHLPFRYEWTMRTLLLGLTHAQKGEGELLRFAQKQNEDLNSLWWKSGVVDI